MATLYAQAAGNWSTAANWNTVQGGGGSTRVPLSTDTADENGFAIVLDVATVTVVSIVDSVGTGTLTPAATTAYTINGDIISSVAGSFGTLTMTDGHNVTVNGQIKNTAAGDSTICAYVSNTTTGCSLTVNATAGRPAIVNTGSQSNNTGLNNSTWGNVNAIGSIGAVAAYANRPIITINGAIQNSGTNTAAGLFAGSNVIINGDCTNLVGATNGAPITFGNLAVNSTSPQAMYVNGRCINNAAGGFPFRCGGTPGSDSTQLGSWADGIAILGSWENNDPSGTRITVRGKSCLQGYCHNNQNCMLVVKGAVTASAGPAALVEATATGATQYNAPLVLLGVATSEVCIDSNSTIIAACNSFSAGLTRLGVGSHWICLGGNPDPSATTQGATAGFTTVVPPWAIQFRDYNTANVNKVVAAAGGHVGPYAATVDHIGPFQTVPGSLGPLAVH